MAKGAKFDMLLSLKTKGQAGLKRMGNSMQGLQGRLKNVRMAALSVNTAFKAMALILTAGAFTRVVKGAIDQADAFGKLSRQTGIAADELQAYVNAGKLAGVEQATIEKGLRRLAQSQREADQGIKTYSESYEALGISVRNADGTLKTSEVLLGNIADRFRDMPNGATKAALAMEIFGRSGAQLIPMLNEGSDALNKWNYETSEGFAANAEYFNDQLTMLSFGFDGFRKQLSDALLPALNAITEVFRDILGSDNDWSGFFNFVEGAIRGIAVTVFGVAKLFQEIGKLGETIINRVKQMMETVDRLTPEWVKKLLGGGVNIAKDLGTRFTTQQKENLRAILGDDYVDEAKARFQSNIPQLNKLISGESEAGEDYYQKGTEKAAALETQLDKTFGTQMQSKLKSFNDSLKSSGEMMADVVIKGIKGMEDALVSFITTGELDFKSLADSIIADMVRIQIQQSITGPLAGMFGNMFKGGNSGWKGIPYALPGMAAGGPVRGGSPYVVGERGPEIFTPRSSGNITPNHKIGGATNINVSVNATESNVNANGGEAKQLGESIAAAIQKQLVKERMPGGLLYT